MTHNVVPVGRGIDPMVGRSWPAQPETQIARPRFARPTWARIRSRFVHGLRNVVQAASDESLVHVIAAGDRRALRALVACHAVQVFRFAMSITGDRLRAEQVVHDVFVEVWHNAGAFDGRARVSTWLLAIARDKAVSALERHPEPIRRIGTGRTLTDCILRLPARDREIVDLVYGHQRSVAETADILRVPRSIVTARMFHARRKIAALLAAAESASASQHSQAGPRSAAARAAG